MADPLAADPVLACNNAIDHFSRLGQELQDDANKHQAKADAARKQAIKAVEDMNAWISAKAKLTGNPVEVPLGHHTTPANRESMRTMNLGNPLREPGPTSRVDPPATSLAKELFDEFQRAVNVHGGGPVETGPVKFSEVNAVTRTVWRGLAAYVLTMVVPKDKPAVKLNDSSDLARSAYEVWWHHIVETITELLKNQGFTDLSSANAEYINSKLAERGWKLAFDTTDNTKEYPVVKGDIITKKSPDDTPLLPDLKERAGDGPW